MPRKDPFLWDIGENNDWQSDLYKIEGIDFRREENKRYEVEYEEPNKEVPGYAKSAKDEEIDEILRQMGGDSRDRPVAQQVYNLRRVHPSGTTPELIVMDFLDTRSKFGMPRSPYGTV